MGLKNWETMGPVHLPTWSLAHKGFGLEQAEYCAYDQ
jgi:hypothetical protein